MQIELSQYQKARHAGTFSERLTRVTDRQESAAGDSKDRNGPVSERSERYSLIQLWAFRRCWTWTVRH